MGTKTAWIIAALLFVSSPCGVGAAPVKIPLMKVDSYPRGPDDHYFKRPLVAFSLAGDDLYACENMASRVVKFSVADGIEFGGEIGRPGQGPGELNLPVATSVSENRLAIKDESGFSFFDGKGLFLKKITTGPGSIGFVLIGDRIHFMNSGSGPEGLIGILSGEGKFLGGYGRKHLKIDYSRFPGLSPLGVDYIVYGGKLLSDGTNLYYLNFRLGYSTAYDPDGREIRRVDFSDLFGKTGRRIQKANEAWISDGQDVSKPNTLVRIGSILLDAAISEGVIYMLSDGREAGATKGTKEIVIKAVDAATFRLSGAYSFPKKEDEQVVAFAAGSRNGQPVFYVSMSMESDNIIAVFVPGKRAGVL